MTATTAPTLMAPPRATTIGFGNLLRSEWTKLRSVRSTYWTAAVAVLGTMLIGILVTIQQEHDLVRHPGDLGNFDPVMTTLTGFFLAQVAVGTLGVMTISSEYGTGMIRATLGAVPQRRALLAAKGAVFLVAVFVVTEILSFTAFAIGQAILHPSGGGVSLGDPGILRAVFGGGLYLTAIGLLSFGLGALIRHTAGALSAFFGIVFAASALVNLLPAAWRDHIQRYLPLNAGAQIMSTQPDSSSLSPWHGFLVLCIYGVVAVGAASVLITRRDA
jgi:ABC-type transport system involved in multi-copper enzyme maturation permease subunit